MAHPALHKVRRHIGLEGVCAKRVTKAPRHAGVPEMPAAAMTFFTRRQAVVRPMSKAARRQGGIALHDAQLEKTIEFAKRIARQRYLTHNAALAALQGLDVRNAAFDVDRRRL